MDQKYHDWIVSHLFEDEDRIWRRLVRGLRDVKLSEADRKELDELKAEKRDAGIHPDMLNDLHAIYKRYVGTDEQAEVIDRVAEEFHAEQKPGSVFASRRRERQERAEKH